MTTTCTTCAAHWRIPPRDGITGMAWIPCGPKDGDLYLVRRTFDGATMERQTPDADGSRPLYVVRPDRCSCPAGIHRKPCKHRAALVALFPEA